MQNSPAAVSDMQTDRQTDRQTYRKRARQEDVREGRDEEAAAPTFQIERERKKVREIHIPYSQV